MAPILIGAAHEAKRDIFTATSVMQASHRPLPLAVCVNPRHASHLLIRAGRMFAVKAVRQDLLGFLAPFRFPIDPLNGQARRRFGIAAAAAPIVDDALAYFECDEAVMLAGDHEIIVGRVLDCRIPDGRTPGWTYSHVADGDHGLAFQRQQLPAL